MLMPAGLRSLSSFSLRRLLAALFALMVAPLWGQQATPAVKILSFNPAEVGIGASAQTLTASFALTGVSGTFTPTAMLHYGRDYTIGTVSCTGGASETCTVAVAFQPQMPGPRKDAIFLMNGTTRLATELLGGVGQSAFSLLQPGSFSTSIPTQNYLYQSVVDENGTVYVLPNGNTPYIEAVTKAGVASQIPLNNPPYFWTISIDGAGVLYLFGESATVTTYDTVQGIQGTYTIPYAGPDIDWYPGVLGEDGTTYVVDQIHNNGTAYQFMPNGGAGYVATFNPGIVQPNTIALDSAGNLFVGGYTINEITPAGVQTQVNTIGASEGLAVDAADTLYATRYSPTFGVAELPAANYSTPIASIDTHSSPLGMSLGADGTVYVSNYINLDIFDRFRTETIDFGEVDPGSSSTVSTGSVYNGGNQPLTILGFVLSGAGFSLDPKASNECAFGTVLAPGALCQASVVFAPTHPGSFPGTITVSSNSLNGGHGNQTFQLTGISYGSYDVVTPNPLVFAPQTPGTSQTLAVTLTNQGNYYPSTIYSVASSNPPFTISQGTCAGATIQVSASCQLQVSFAPTAVQSYAGTATIVTYVSGTAQAAQTITLPLSGTGAGPLAATPVITPGTGTYSSSQQVTITDATPNATIYYTTDGSTPTASSTKYTAAITVNSSEILNAIATATGYSNSAIASASYTLTTPALSHSPASLGFGNVPVGDTNSSMTVTVTNVSNTYSFNIVPSISNAAFSGGTCGSPVAPGASCLLTLAFTPAAVQAYSATVTVAASAPGCPGCVFPSDSFAVTGTGIAQPPVLTISPASLNFGNVVVNTNSTVQSVTATNNSATDTIALGSFFTTSSATLVAGGSGCSMLAPGASCTVSVVFSPSAIQTFSGTVNLQPQAIGCGGCVRNYPAQTIAVTGTGIPQPPVLTISPASLNFGNVVVNTNSTVQSVTATNNSATDTIALGSFFTTSSATLVAGGSGCSMLAPGASCTVSVVFSPSAIQTFSGTVNLQPQASGCGGCVRDYRTQTIAVTGTGIAQPPVLQFSPATLDFGNQIVNTSSAPQSITVTNISSTDTVVLSSIAVFGSPFLIQPSSCLSPVAPGMSCTIPFIFTPGTVQAFSATVTIQVQASGCGGCVRSYPAQTFNVTGTGIAQPPVLKFSLATLDFGNQIVNTSSAPQSITVTNISSTDTVVLSSIAVFGSPFLIQPSSCLSPVAPGMSCTIPFIFTPGAVQAFSATVTIQVQASGCGGCVRSYPAQTFNVIGTGIAQPPVLKFSLATLDFGNQIVNTSSAPQSITVTNISSTDTIVILVPSTQAFATQLISCSTLAPGATCNIAFIFTPTVAQPYAASFTIQVQAATGCSGCAHSYPGQTFNLIGTGVGPMASLTAASMSFTTAVGTISAPQAATLTNTGAAFLSIFNISITGVSPNDYQQTNNCGLLLAVGASCTISVTFTPAAAGSYPANLTVSDNDPASPQIINLTGSANTSPNFGVSSPANPVTVPPGGSAQYVLTVTAQNGATIPAVTFSATGLPPGAIATFSPSTITPGNTSATSTLTIQTSNVAALTNAPFWPIAAPTLALIGWFFFPRKRRRDLIHLCVLLFASLGVLSGLTGCGTGYPPPKSYTITVTASVGSIQQTIAVQLTVE